MSYTVEELSVLRESLNHITIKGSDALRISELQIKLEKNISNLNSKLSKGTTSKWSFLCIYTKLLARKGSGHRTIDVTNRNRVKICLIGRK